MTRYATARLPTALGLSVLGGLVSVLAGLPEVALLVTPWLVVSVLGLVRSGDVTVEVSTETATKRVLVGDTVELTATVSADGDALVTLAPWPDREFTTAGEPEPEAQPKMEPVSSDREAVVDFELPANQWGTHNVGRMTVDVTLPYGLFGLRGAAVQTESVRVHPTPTQLRQLLTPWMVRKVSGTHRSGESARGIEYADIRPYGPGDSVRDINWRISARSDDLWISERHPDRATDVVLFVDSFVESGHDIRRIFGLVVEAAIAVAESHLGATDRVGLIEFGGIVRWVNPGTGRIQLQRLTDALLSTGLYANAADKELPAMHPKALPPRSFVLAFSPLLDERFVEAVSALRARGHDVTVIECVPDHRSPSEEVPPSAAAALDLWLAERTALRDQFAETGVAIAQWDGTEHLDVVLDELLRRRRRAIRTGGR